MSVRSMTGFARVRKALPEGELVVNSSQGGGSKDTWVLLADRPAAEPAAAQQLTAAAQAPDGGVARQPGPAHSQQGQQQ